MKKVNDSKDKRIINTENALRKSLLALMKKHPIAGITTTELCRHANINRNTFYSHYDSPLQLLECMEEEMYQEFISMVKNLTQQDNMISALTQICQLAYKNRDLYITVLSENGDPRFMKRAIGVTHDFMVLYWKNSNPTLSNDQLEMLYAFLLGGNISVIGDWAKSGMEQPPEKIALFMDKMYAAITDSLKAK